MKNLDSTIENLREAASAGKLVAIIGTGVSMCLSGGSQRQLSWPGLIESGFLYAETKGRIAAAQRSAWDAQLKSSDLDDLLSAAEFVGRKLGAPERELYARWLEYEFEAVSASSIDMVRALRNICNAKIPIATINYDTLLESVLNVPSLTLDNMRDVAGWVRRERSEILHLHGVWKRPETCVLGIRDYESAIKDEARHLVQRTLSAFNRLLFIGCGGTFADPNFTALVGWLRANMSAASLQHYALVSEAEVAARHADPTWQGFVEPVSYGRAYDDLPVFLSQLFPGKKSASKANIRRNSAYSKRDGELVLSEYREFLIRDCGQMTIEGVRADMDTAQRRFDLEKLFVPLEVRKTPPDIALSDPDREAKLQTWEKKNNISRPFGKEFVRQRRIALLALPGGGKTLLLKRLAVAYADGSRRESSNDNLPDLSLTPVLIRCREWRDHIRKPIMEILSSIPEIAGVPTLSGIREALLPVLKSGKVLFLIDGLDEIHNDADRATFVEHLESFLEIYPKIRLVVTSREAGFSLVAPTLSRFCTKLRVAPLRPEAIEMLSSYWHHLMSSGSPESIIESKEVAAHLLSSPPLRRLAENPLLLTMLLVVKHGAGRLPPDRVSLYDRAVEVLLDTWNIKGHEPLKLKEAVPQLACLAFEMMKQGNQTATAKEIIEILEMARDSVPQIRRYATDAPDEFLKRVELRSSLLMEGGHKLEGIRTVPFYQFRHLTFQEYLSAVAAAEGHYMSYRRGQTVLTPLEGHLTAEEWKEVVPMAAVLARKQAEPLISALVAEGAELCKLLRGGRPLKAKTSGSWLVGFQPLRRDFFNVLSKKRRFHLKD